MVLLCCSVRVSQRVDATQNNAALVHTWELGGLRTGCMLAARVSSWVERFQHLQQQAMAWGQLMAYYWRGLSGKLLCGRQELILDSTALIYAGNSCRAVAMVGAVAGMLIPFGPSIEGM